MNTKRTSVTSATAACSHPGRRHTRTPPLAIHGALAMPILIGVAVTLVVIVQQCLFNSNAVQGALLDYYHTLTTNQWWGTSFPEQSQLPSSSSIVVGGFGAAHYLLGIATIAAATILTAPYGRHADQSSQWTVSPFVSWVCQEIPTLIAAGIVVIPGLVWWFPSVRECVGVTHLAGLKVLDSIKGQADGDDDDNPLLLLIATGRPLLISTTKRFWNEIFQNWLNPPLLTTGAAVFYPSLLLFILHYTHRTLIYPNFLGGSPNRVPWYVTVLACGYCAFNGVLQGAVNTVSSHNSETSRDIAYQRIVGTTGMASSLQKLARSTTTNTKHTSISDSNNFFDFAILGCKSILGEMFGLNHVALPMWFGVGVTMFFAGMSINVFCDYYILSLRKEKKKTTTAADVATRGDKNDEIAASVKSAYVIPTSIFHKFVSCPNFAAEIFEWTGYAVAVYGASGLFIPFAVALSFPVYTLCNLGPRAMQHHNWYLEHFGDEYRNLNRKALIPCIF